MASSAASLRRVLAALASPACHADSEIALVVAHVDARIRKSVASRSELLDCGLEPTVEKCIAHEDERVRAAAVAWLGAFLGEEESVLFAAILTRKLRQIQSESALVKEALLKSAAQLLDLSRREHWLSLLSEGDLITSLFDLLRDPSLFVATRAVELLDRICALHLSAAHHTLSLFNSLHFDSSIVHEWYIFALDLLTGLLAHADKASTSHLLQRLMPSLRALLFTSDAVLHQRIIKILWTIFKRGEFGAFAPRTGREYLSDLFMDLVAHGIAALPTALKIVTVPLDSDKSHAEWSCGMISSLHAAITNPQSSSWVSLRTLHVQSPARFTAAVCSWCESLIFYSHVRHLISSPWLDFIALYVNEALTWAMPNVASQKSLIAAMQLITRIFTAIDGDMCATAPGIALAHAICAGLKSSSAVMSLPRVAFAACQAFAASHSLVLHNSDYKIAFTATLRELCYHSDPTIRCEALILLTSLIGIAVVTLDDLHQANIILEDVLESGFAFQDANVRKQTVRLLATTHDKHYLLSSTYETLSMLICILEDSSSLVRHEAAMAISSPQISTHFLDRVDETILAKLVTDHDEEVRVDSVHILVLLARHHMPHVINVFAVHLVALSADVVRRVRKAAIMAIVELIEAHSGYQDAFSEHTQESWQALLLEQDADLVYNLNDELALFEVGNTAQTLDCPI